MHIFAVQQSSFPLHPESNKQREDYAACLPSKASKSILFSLKTQPAAKYPPLLPFHSTNSTWNKNEVYSNALIFKSNVNSQSSFLSKSEYPVTPEVLHV